MYEMEIARLQGEVERLQKEKAFVQAQATQSAAEVELGTTRAFGGRCLRLGDPGWPVTAWEVVESP